MRIKNQKGIALIEGLIIIVILVIIGGVGYYTWRVNRNDSKGSNIRLDSSYSNTGTLLFASNTKAPNSGITVEPVLVPKCKTGKVCQNYDLPFPHPYTVYATLHCPAGEVCPDSVVSDNATGPGEYNMVLTPGIYSLSWSSLGYTTDPFVSGFTITVTKNQFTGVFALHFSTPTS